MEVTGDALAAMLPQLDDGFRGDIDDPCYPCHKCAAKCCKYVIIEVDADDPSYLRYLMYHGLSLVFTTTAVEGGVSGSFGIHLKTHCTKLDGNRCTIYDDPNRPDICHTFSSSTCSDNPLVEGDEGKPAFIKTEAELDAALRIFQALENKHAVEDGTEQA